MRDNFLPSLASVKQIARLALPAAAAQSVQVFLMVSLSRSAGRLGVARLAANGLSEIIMVVAAIQPLIAIGLGSAAAISHCIGGGESSSKQQQAQKQQQRCWQIHNPEAVWVFWSSLVLNLAFAFFVCTPAAVFVGPRLLSFFVDPDVLEMASHQLALLCLYPIVFAAYFSLAQLCVVEKRAELLVYASLPVVVVMIPVLNVAFGFMVDEEDHHSGNESTQKNVAAFRTLALGWLFAMLLELALMIALCGRNKVIPPFGRVVDKYRPSSSPPRHDEDEEEEVTERGALVDRQHRDEITVAHSDSDRDDDGDGAVTHVPWQLYMDSLFQVPKTSNLILLWILPSLLVFIAGHTAFELGFVIGSSSSAASPSSSRERSRSRSCTAATLVVAHQVRFSMTLIPHGIVTALNTLFSRAVGSRDWPRAGEVVIASVSLGLLVTISEGFLLHLLAEKVPAFFHTSDACVAAEFQEAAPSMAWSLTFEYVVWQMVTILRSLGHRQWALVATATSWWVLTLPSIVFFSFEAKRGAASVFDGALVGQGLMAPVAIWLAHLAWRRAVRYQQQHPSHVHHQYAQQHRQQRII